MILFMLVLQIFISVRTLFWTYILTTCALVGLGVCCVSELTIQLLRLKKIAAIIRKDCVVPEVPNANTQGPVMTESDIIELETR